MGTAPGATVKPNCGINVPPFEPVLTILDNGGDITVYEFAGVMIVPMVVDT